MTLFARLFLLLGLLSSVSLALVAGLLWRTSSSLESQLRAENDAAGARVLARGTTLLENSLSDTHTIIVSEKARKVELYLDAIADSLQLQAKLTRQFLSDSGDLRDAPPLWRGNDLTHAARGNPAFARDFAGKQPYAIFHLAPGVSPEETRSERERLRRLGTFFAHTKATLPNCDSVYFGSKQGFILGYPGGKSFFKPTYDPRKRPWYEKASARKNGEIAWIVTVDRDEKTYFLTAARTVTLAGETAPRGVVAIDVRLSDVLNELFKVGNLNVSSAVLVDDAHRIRVRAAYSRAPRGNGNNAETAFDISGALNPPLAAQSEFAPVFSRVREAPNVSRDIYWAGREEGVPMARAQNVFIYSTVRFGRDIRAQNRSLVQPNRSEDWVYAVRLPMQSVLKPVTSIGGEMRGATRGISEAIAQRTRQSSVLMLGLSGLTLGLSLLVAYFAARATSRPLVQMASVTRGVGEGNLEQLAPETGGGEIGEMGRSINAMIRGLKQRNLLQETFGRYVAPSVVQEVLERGGVQVGGVKSEATIFFSDLQGFTAFAEATEPEVLVALLNEYFDAMTKVILGSGGTLDKYIGDAILAFWGHPIAHEDDAVRACAAALQQAKCLEELCDNWESQGKPRLKMRIGIETGPVIVGDFGSELKVNYTVIGDTVNFASRLEGANKFYGTQILIGERTRELAGDAIWVREIDLLVVSGKNVSVRVFELLGMKDNSNTLARGFEAYEAALLAYRNCDWKTARAEIERAQKELGRDKPSEVLLRKIENLEATPPPENWDGTTVLNEK